MEDKDIPKDGPSNWQPITHKPTLALLGKLGEEVCECGSSIFRCIIQGIDEAEPRTGKVNRQWLEDEVADVYALLQCVVFGLNLDQERIHTRATAKIAYKQPWFDELRRAAETESDGVLREEEAP